MRIHCLENVDKALTFLIEQRVHLENMGAHDIVDGNPRLTLGLIWTIILRFQVKRILFCLASVSTISMIWSVALLKVIFHHRISCAIECIEQYETLNTLSVAFNTVISDESFQ